MPNSPRTGVVDSRIRRFGATTRGLLSIDKRSYFGQKPSDIPCHQREAGARKAMDPTTQVAAQLAAVQALLRRVSSPAAHLRHTIAFLNFQELLRGPCLWQLWTLLACDMMSETEGMKFQANWEVAKAQAKLRLEHNRKDLPELGTKLRHLCKHWILDSPEWRLAVCVWLEELGPVFDLPLDGHVFQAYDVRKMRKTILDRRNAAKVVETLRAAAEKFVKNIGEEPDSETPALHPGLALKVNMWKTLTGMSDLCNTMTVPILKSWEQKWEVRNWEVWKELLRGSERLRMRANVFDWSQECEARWLHAETKCNMVEMGWTGNLTFLKPRWSKEAIVDERKQFIEGVKGYVASKPREFALDFIADVQLEMKVASKSLQVLQTRLQSEMAAEVKRLLAEKESLERRNQELQEEKRRIELTASMELERRNQELQEEKRRIELTSSTELARVLAQAEKAFETEKAKLQAEVRVEVLTCQICMVKPRNVVILPCAHGQYCQDCLEKHRRTKKTCPYCRAPITGSFQYWN